MKTNFIIIALLIGLKLFAQSEIKVSDGLSIYQLSEHCYEHTQNHNNGLIFINNGEAVIVSTPDSDEETQNLIDWVRNEKQATIVAYVIDRWHPDAMQGLDIVQQNGIKNYACHLTRKIAIEKNLPVAEKSFRKKKTIKVGGEKVICHYLGQAHTPDGIVVYVPSEKVLFGGNEIRNYNGWVGNIGDANVNDWGETAQNVKKEYGEAKVVVPGHGKYGGAELLDYTIDLFSHIQTPSDAQKTLESKFKTDSVFSFPSETLISKDENGKQTLKNAVMVVQDVNKYVRIESPEIVFQPEKGRVDSKTGRITIFDKTASGEELRSDVNYNKLIIYKYDETIGFVVVLKEIIKEL